MATNVGQCTGGTGVRSCTLARLVQIEQHRNALIRGGHDSLIARLWCQPEEVLYAFAIGGGVHTLVYVLQHFGGQKHGSDGVTRLSMAGGHSCRGC